MATGLPNAYKHLRDNQQPLRFRNDGTFRILHLTDIHEVHPDMDDDENRSVPINKSAETIHVIEDCLDRTNPDLVVFGGDNISGHWEEFTYDYMAHTIRKIIAPIVKRKIPLAIVFGNHDSERADTLPFLQRENQINIYAEYDNFRGCFNEEDVFGCGNYTVPILSHDSDRINWNIWCIDSNDYLRNDDYTIQKNPDGYGFVHDDQIEWYEKKSVELREKNGGKPVPSILFQHIPVLQEYAFCEETTKGTPGAFEKDGKYFVPKKGVFSQGSMREAPCPTPQNGKQFESWVKMGDIVAAFFGHDHTNTFIGEIEKIKLIQSLGAGYHSYGIERGGRLIVLHENTREFDTETLIVKRIFLK